MMLNSTYGMIHTFRDSTMIKSFAGALWIPISSRSSTFATPHLEAVTMDQLGQPRKFLIAGSTGPPFLEMLVNSSPLANNVREQEWPL
ncbi:hypothetical protein CR513_28984, partial [Mucuna pruriens]